jgi:competence protein ComEA
MINEKYKRVFLIALILVIGFSVTIYKKHFKPISKNFAENTVNIETRELITNNYEQAIKVKNKILVHIGGAVRNPGLYKLDANLRTLDAIKIAGGLLDNANLDKVNLAKKLKDGQKIQVPFKKKVAKKTVIKKRIEINLNTANLDQLCEIPGIGPNTARKIIELRDTLGSFTNFEELTKISGIGKSKLRKLAPFIKL